MVKATKRLNSLPADSVDYANAQKSLDEVRTLWESQVMELRSKHLLIVSKIINCCKND